MNSEITFEAFYEKNYSAMVSYCYHSFGLTKQDAEDIVSEAFTLLWKRFETIDPRTAPVLFAWIRKTVRNLSYDHNRAAAKKSTVELEQWIAEAEADPDSALLSEDPILIERQYRDYLAQIREKLPPKQQRLFDCVVVGNLDIPTTAKLLNRKEHTVRVALGRLRKKLQTDILPDILS